jgi:hypothetical protein
MNPQPSKEQWKASIRATAEALQRISDQELRGMTEEEGLRRLWSLGTVEKPWRERPDWSGLVEQQAYFHRRRKP